MGSRVDDVVKTVKRFVDAHWDRTRPLLLGYSGGPDSKALFYALVECGVRIHVAHVDHGWREESGEEANAIREEASQLGVPCHSVKFTPSSGVNLEEEGREARLRFFRSLQIQIGFQALLLGHQADDGAELVLQRVLEGAHLPFLGGMQEIGDLDGLLVWRPLLKIKKQKLLDWLEQKQLAPFFDPSNQADRFLRARLRTRLFPLLPEVMGKGVETNLALLGARAFELQKYLEKKTASRWDARVESPCGMALNLNQLERIEARFLLQKGAPYLITRTILEQLLDQIEQQQLWRRFFVSQTTLVAHRGWCFFFYRTPKILALSEIKSLLRQFNLFLL